eukprot:CAMPEP_0198475210 /NCGR_PEP_ID=MMETSP1456-20131121/40699_1 /TAXON_ID=1461544 ORGANISM="Unidentified sp., Strain RCC1871" /NCGR_SAMPLE_ID=MMETSP1456 /ASSEMBLY_ACC=CAM_ASM_001119 /LENGTH=445 /DNA_ID=CAMNT_0044201907 /DNA_START=37 /DNA_END=1371 /DNA_ORIENTATION=+
MESTFDDGKALRQMEAAVVEERQIVSFKWVAREFEVNARKARSLLEDLAKGKLSDKLRRIHLVCGYTKAPKRSHVVQLVPEEKLAETEEALERVTSRSIYSVQPCALKDPGALWSAEYTQVDALFSEPADCANSLRDNRMSDVTCKEVRREAVSQVGTGPTPKGKAAPKTEGASGGNGLGAKAASSAPAKSGGISLNTPRKASGGIGLGAKASATAKSGGISLNTPRKKGGVGLGASSGRAAQGTAPSKSKSGGISLNTPRKASGGIGLGAKASATAADSKAKASASSRRNGAALAEESDEEDLGATKKLARRGLAIESESESEADPVDQEEDEQQQQQEEEEEKEEEAAPRQQAEAPRGGGLSLSLGRDKRSGASGGGRAKKRVKTFINEKGEEVCMEVDEDDGAVPPPATAEVKAPSGSPEVENKNPNPAQVKQEAKNKNPNP